MIRIVTCWRRRQQAAATRRATQRAVERGLTLYFSGRLRCVELCRDCKNRQLIIVVYCRRSSPLFGIGAAAALIRLKRRTLNGTQAAAVWPPRARAPALLIVMLRCDAFARTRAHLLIYYVVCGIRTQTRPPLECRRRRRRQRRRWRLPIATIAVVVAVANNLRAFRHWHRRIDWPMSFGAAKLWLRASGGSSPCALTFDAKMEASAAAAVCTFKCSRSRSGRRSAPIVRNSALVFLVHSLFVVCRNQSAAAVARRRNSR